MKQIACVAVGSWIALGFVSCRFSTARAVAESPDPFVRMAEVEQKRQLVLDEIERLGPGHPWAGVYECDSPLRFSLAIAPDSGGVSTIFGCFGLRDSKWSPVRVFPDPDSELPRAIQVFGTRYSLHVDASRAILRSENGGAYWRQEFQLLPFERSR